MSLQHLCAVGLLLCIQNVMAQRWDWLANASSRSDYLNKYELLQTDSNGNSYMCMQLNDTTSIENTNGDIFCCLNSNARISYYSYIVKFNRKGKLIWYRKFNYDIRNSHLYDNELYVLISAKRTQVDFGNYAYKCSDKTSYLLLNFTKDGIENKILPLFETEARMELNSIAINKDNFIGSFIINLTSSRKDSVICKNRVIQVKDDQQIVLNVSKESGNLNWFKMYFESAPRHFNFSVKDFISVSNSAIYVPINTSDSGFSGIYQFPKIIKFDNNGVPLVIKSLIGNGSGLGVNFFNRMKMFGNNLIVISGIIKSDELYYDGKKISKKSGSVINNSFLLILDSNLNYRWHYLAIMDDPYIVDFEMDTLFNLYVKLDYDGIRQPQFIYLPNGKKFPSGLNHNKQAIILKFNRSWEFIDQISLSTNESYTFTDLQSDNLGNLYALIPAYTANYAYRDFEIDIDEFYFKGIYNKSFLAKLNTHLLKINQDTLWCASDSLSAKYDTVAFKRLAWFFKDTLRQTGEKYRPNLTRTGKYKVRLTAYEWDSCSSTIGDSFMYYQPPKIKVTRPQIGCVYAPFWFTDSSYFDNYPNIQLQVKIDFGDGTDTTCFRYLAALKSFKLYHVYTDSGTYEITYTIMHQGCSNSFTTKVKILPAPRPGIVCLPAEGCTPLKIDFQRKYTDLIDSVSWQISKHTMVFKGQPQNFTINNAGKFWLSQKIYGPTGCVTRDSILLTVRQGMPANTKPYLIQATLLNNFNVEVMWQKVPHAAQYELYLPNGTSKRLIDTAFNQLFNTEINTPLTYKIRALDSCENPSMESNIGRTIFCTAKEIPGASKNDLPASVVSFTSYLDWREGVKNYTIETKFSTETLWQPLVLINDTSFADLQFTKANEFIKCYRINATSNSGVTSISNELCLPYQPVIFIPSAVTPNEDGLNDDFDFYTYGIENIHTEIYNRWGMKIWEGGKNEKWKPAINNMDGVYVYIINGKSASTGTPLQFKGTITVF